MFIVENSCLNHTGSLDDRCRSIGLIKTPDQRRGAPAAATIDSSYSGVAADIEAEHAAAKAPVSPTEQLKSPRAFKLWEKEDFSFGDFVDVINPLQHIPIVATLYRNLTQDKIGFVPRVIGGAVWGRIGGFVAGLVNAAVEWFTGKDIGDHIYTALFGGSGGEGIKTAAAAATIASSTHPASDSVRADKQISELTQDPPPAPVWPRKPKNPAALYLLSNHEPLPLSRDFLTLPARLLSPHAFRPYSSSDARDEETTQMRKLRLTA